jgi:hypothetical protein
MASQVIKYICTALLLGAVTIAVAGCGEEEVSTGSFKGAQGEVAQRISEFQSSATKGENQSICKSDLAASLTARLSDCQQAIKDQLAEIDKFTLSIESVAIEGDTATATVKSVYGGKTKPSKLKLVKEGKDWKISGLG